MMFHCSAISLTVHTNESGEGNKISNSIAENLHTVHTYYIL